MFGKAKKEQEKTVEEARSLIKQICFSTTSKIEGKEVVTSHGLVLGTEHGKQYDAPLLRLKVLGNMAHTAKKMGANAIVGLNLDYTAFSGMTGSGSNYALMVNGVGTAVVVEDK